MAIFIDSSDFVSVPYKIPNQEEETSLDNYFVNKEEQLLKDLLGYAFAQELIDQALTSGTPAAKWMNLINGDEYTYNDKTYKWVGLRKLLIPAIYAEWVGDSFDKLTNIGVGINSKDNFTVISPGVRISRAWNTYSEMCGASYCQQNTLFGYLQANASDFTEYWDGYFNEYPGTRNVLDL